MALSISEQIYLNGYAIFDCCDMSALSLFAKVVQDELKTEELSCIHTFISRNEINKRRLACFRALNKVARWEDLYASAFQNALDHLIGPDIAIQNKLNLSIQMPGDVSSVLQMHTDSLAGQSIFELVCWLPLTNAYESNSMYIFHPDVSKKILTDLPAYEKQGMDGLFAEYKSRATFIDIKYGQVLVFSPTLFHGNIVNDTKETRISINCRFKNIFAPESECGERRLGSFYRLHSLSPLTRLALSYRDDLISFR